MKGEDDGHGPRDRAYDVEVATNYSGMRRGSVRNLMDRIRGAVDELLGRNTAEPVQLIVLVEEDEDDGGFVATLQNSPGVMGQGETEREAVSDALAAFVCVLQANLDLEHEPRRPSPPDSPASHTSRQHEHRVPLGV